jgi:DNA-binding MarR family transcriptional regulator/GNAT superfamily N-acetyltransferase
MESSDMPDALVKVREFNRFFTQFVGALDSDFLGSRMTLPEARVLFELASRKTPVASDLQTALDMDSGYLSRILRRFEKRGWIARSSVEHDRRRQTIGLRRAGRTAFRDVDSRQREKVNAILGRLTPYEQRDLVTALSLTRVLLGGAQELPFSIRPFEAADMGLIASRQSLLYRETYGWGPGIEVNVGEAATAFLRNYKAGREQCWVAEVGDVMAGSIFVTDEGDGVSRLRLFYVEPFARGRGIGNALVSECIAFSRNVGYESMTLWTHTILESARRIYAAYGFEIVEVETHSTFGVPVQGETWRLDLGPVR